jgi:zinc/manganese transport system substrate-binding protein
MCALVIASGCSANAERRPPRGRCPVEPVRVVVTVGQWSDVVAGVGGDCVDVATVISGTSADPHDYEPTPRDVALFDRARLVVRNGLGYDTWADRALAGVDRSPAVVDAGTVVGLPDGANPHLWYSPRGVGKVADAVGSRLRRLLPGAIAYLRARRATWHRRLGPYADAIDALRGLSRGRTYGATEPVFDDMARALGLTDATPPGYRRAALNDSDPAPADVTAFERSLRAGDMSVLVVNAQTESPTADELRRIARQTHVPVVEVTETMPSGSGGFVEWQIGQLRALAGALRA